MNRPALCLKIATLLGVILSNGTALWEVTHAAAAEARPSRAAEWDRVLAEAKKEGEVRLGVFRKLRIRTYLPLSPKSIHLSRQ